MTTAAAIPAANASGTYMMLFFASSIRAGLRAKYVQHIDTNWTWLTADTLLTDSWSVRLVPGSLSGARGS